MKVIPETCRDL